MKTFHGNPTKFQPKDFAIPRDAASMAKTLHEPCMSECVSVYLLRVAQSEWLHFPESFSAPRLQEATYLHVGHQHRDNHRHEHAIGQAEDHLVNIIIAINQ